MPPTAVEKSFCTTREAANLLGVSVGTVQLWVESGLLEAWKTEGGHRRVVRDSIERLLHKPTFQVSPPPAPRGLQSPPSALPVAALAPGQVAPIESAPTAEQRPLRVVVVDDDAALLRLYNVQLSRWPMKPDVVAVDNGFAALLLIGRESPDLLILDLNMPEMDGFGMLHVLGNAPEARNTRIVVVTGMDSSAIDARGGLPIGIEVLPKPVPFARLQAIAEEICASARSQLQGG